jgi:hypothetical protein
VGGYPTNMLGLISVGLGVSVLPQFEKIERISGIAWRTLEQAQAVVGLGPGLAAPGGITRREQFVAAAEKQCPVPPGTNRAEF